VLEYAGSSAALLRWYAYGLGSNDVLSQITLGGTRATMVPNIQGSVLATLDSGTGAFTRQNYLPYGKSDLVWLIAESRPQVLSSAREGKLITLLGHWAAAALGCSTRLTLEQT
jgi:hypothetical protein